MSIIGEKNINEIIEPSCGDGSFYNHNKYVPHFGYDIEPQCDFSNVIKGDYLAQDIKYLPGRLVIGNPPYGRCLNLAQKFFKKSIGIADYIAFILPISQLNNTRSMYEFDLIFSDDLGKRLYTDRDLHCCFNIYKRPINGKLNPKPKSKLDDVTIYRQDCTGYEEKLFDLRMCYWGDGTAVKILSNNERYSAEYKIKINNENLKDQIVKLLLTFNWKDYLNCIAMRKIQQFHIVDVLKNNILNIK
ncbi:hypothetical protein AALB39_03860 [Lachnospiraceae bacterium 54-53]